MEENPCSLTQGRRYVRFASGSLARLFTSFSQSLSHLCKLFVGAPGACGQARRQVQRLHGAVSGTGRPAHRTDRGTLPLHPLRPTLTFSDRQQPIGICGGLAGGPRDSPRLHAEGQVPDLLEHPRPLLRQEALRKCLPLAVPEEISQ